MDRFSVPIARRAFVRLGMLAIGASLAAACAPPADSTSTLAPADAPQQQLG
jgi:hypothetical protein